MQASESHGSRTVSRWVAALGLFTLTFSGAVPCRAYDLLLRWTVPPQSDITGYRIYAGAASRTYNLPVDVGLLSTVTLNGVVYYVSHNLQLSTAYYTAVTAYNSAGMESDYSNEKLLNLSSATPPSANAGPDLTGVVGQALTLGSASQPGISYFWEQTAGPTAILSSRITNSTQFTAATAGTFQFALTAYDGQGVAAQDTVSVSVTAPPTLTPTAVLTAMATLTLTPTLSPTRTSIPTSATPTPVPALTCITVRPSGPGAFLPQNQSSGCSNGWPCLQTADGDGSYVFSASTEASGPNTDIYALDQVTARADPIQFVNIHVMSRSVTPTGGSSVTWQLKVGANPTLFAGVPLPTLTDYLDLATVRLTNPATNSAWTWSDINNLQAGVRLQVAAGDELRTTNISVDVCFVPSGPPPTTAATASASATTSSTATATATATLS